jgi:hypothetical protein
MARLLLGAWTVLAAAGLFWCSRRAGSGCRAHGAAARASRMGWVGHSLY